jgi:prenyltransferase beta subunit
MIDFLDATDDLLRQGASQLSPAFRQAQVQFVLTQQTRHGGFGGSAGPADLYYSDFAVRCLIMLDGPDESLRCIAGWVEQQTPADLIHRFCALNTRRLLRTRGISLRELSGSSPAVPGDRAYGTFLGLLTCQLQHEPFRDGVTAVLTHLRRSDGGFAESVGGMHGHTNATAAALASLWMAGEADAEALESALDFLAARQSADGGFAAHAGINSGDLLSTFTALLSLAMLGRTEIDLGGVARFLRQCARSGGGFAAAADAAAPVDVEYTWYGVGLACLLRQLSAISS